VIAGEFSSGKEIREQEFYYETIVLLILVGNRVGQSPSRKYRSSTECKALFSFEHRRSQGRPKGPWPVFPLKCATVQMRSTTRLFAQ